MRELSFQEVTQANWRAALDLAVFPEQQRFIAEYVPIKTLMEWHLHCLTSLLQ